MLTRVLLGLVLLLAAIPPSMGLAPATAPTCGQPIYSDDFNALDLGRYSTLYPHGNRWLEGESEIYVDPAFGHLGLNPFSVADGVVTISANVAPKNVPEMQGRRYTSGLLTTYKHFAHGYGYFEIRARLPRGKGTWPAFWLLPTSLVWPPEIDVMEAFGDDPTHYSVTVHYSVNKQHEQTSFTLTTPDLTAGFHRYGVLWTRDYIAWYFDGKVVAQASTPPELQDVKAYMLLNLAIGGVWSGQPDGNTPFPATFQIDYLRAYDLPARLR